MKKLVLFIVTAIICGLTVKAQDVWVFGNNDDDYTTPPFNDSLIIFDTLGNMVASATNLNTSEGTSSRRLLQVANDGSYAWVTGHAGDSIIKIDNLGNKILTIEKNIAAMYLTKNNNLYALSSDGTFNGDSIFILNNNGQVTDSAKYGGYDIAVDEINYAVWIVGADIKRLDLNLNLVFVKDPVLWAALSVDIGDNGNIWVAVGKHPDYPASKNCVYEISSSGDTVKSINLTSRPYCVRYDTLNKKVWIATSAGTFIYNTKLSGIAHIDDYNSYSVDLNCINNTAWVAGSNSIRKYNLDGALRLYNPLPSGVQRHVGIKKTIDAPPDGLSEINTSDLTLYPNPGRDNLTIRGAENNSVISIFDIAGKLVMNQQLIDNQIDVSNLQPGVYTLRITDRNGNKTSKFIKQ